MELLTGGHVCPFFKTEIVCSFDLDPTKRDTFWIIFIGSAVGQISFIALKQSGVQKFLTLPTFRDCVW
jgi:sodium-coupled monocarboxylate transporter 8/12